MSVLTWRPRPGRTPRTSLAAFPVPCWVGTVFSPIASSNRHRKGKELAQNHTARKKGDQHSNSGSRTLGRMLLQRDKPSPPTPPKFPPETPCSALPSGAPASSAGPEARALSVPGLRAAYQACKPGVGDAVGDAGCPSLSPCVSRALALPPGFIHEDHLRELLTTMGDRFTDEEVDEMYREAPIDKKGNFNYVEFTRILKHGAKDKDD